MEPKDLILLILMPVILVGIVSYINLNPSITGAVTAQDKESNVIGAYSIIPSFKAKIGYDLKDYNTINGLLGTILECYKTGNGIGSCLEKAQNNDNNFEWILGCDKGAEKILYDFAEFYQDCIDSDDNNCICRKNLGLIQQDIQEYELNDKYEMTLSEDRLNKKIEIKMSEPPVDLSYKIDTNGIVGWFPQKISLGYTKDKLSDLVMIFREEITGQQTPVSSLGQPLNEIVIYKNDNNPSKIKSADFVRDGGDTLVYPAQSRNTKKPDDLHECRLNPKNLVKFCVTKKDSKAMAYSKSDNMVKERNIVYKFAVTLPNTE